MTAVVLMAWSTLAPLAEVAHAAEVADTTGAAPAGDTSAAVPLASTSASHVPPDSAAVSRLALALSGSPAARIGMGTHSYVVLHPRTEPTGIGFSGLEGFPPPRPAVIAMGKWDTVPPPPNPIPWTEIHSVDKRVMTRTPTAIYGAVLGGLFFSGATYALGKFAEGEGGEPVEAPVVIGIGLAGAVVGGLIGYLFQSSTWVEEYPQPKR
jgi:hypothetical protein